MLLRVRAASVHADVWHVLTGLPYVLRLMGAGLRKPKNPVPGTDTAGIVESVGKKVTRFRPGDEVFGETLRGHEWQNGGAYAEYAAAPEFALALKPANITFEPAAAVPTSALIAIPALRIEGNIQAGHQVLINGAGGGVGSIAVRLAKAFGTEVTSVDCTEKPDILRTLGADHVIDYTEVDFTRGDERSSPEAPTCSSGTTTTATGCTAGWDSCLAVRLVKRALHLLEKAAGDTSKSLYDRKPGRVSAAALRRQSGTRRGRLNESLRP